MEATETITTLEGVVEHYFPGSRIEESHVGGVGVVAKVRDGNNQAHAVKLVEKPRRNEFDVTQLEHPNLPKVYKTKETPESYTMTMEWVEGTPLHALLDERDNNGYSRRCGSPQVKREIAHQLLKTLSYLESKGLVHGDIKTNNIMVANTGEISEGSSTVQVKIIDLDTIAPHNDYQDFSWSPHYASPEQRQLKVERNTDIYLLGVVLFELLTGEHPIERVVRYKKNKAVEGIEYRNARTYMEWYEAVEEQATNETQLALFNGVPLNELLDLHHFEPKVAYFFHRLLARSEDRYQTVDEVRKGLEESGLFKACERTRESPAHAKGDQTVVESLSQYVPGLRYIVKALEGKKAKQQDVA